MKAAIITGLLCAVIGATAGWMFASDRHEAKARKEQAAYSKTLAEVNQRIEHYQSISEEYYADYQDAINREPAVVTERVFVRANCPTNAAADSGGELGNAATVERAELHAETVRSATEVTYQAERDVLSCRAALHSLQRKIIKHNELQR